MAQISYGSITIVDVTDVGQFSVYPRASASKTQIYNPDADSYMPNWDTDAGGTKVVISPVAYYAGRNVTTSATYTWQRRNGGGTASALITGEEVVQGKLEITKNVLAQATGGLITYVCTANYVVDGIALQAIGEIDFSLVRQGSAAKIAKITGDNVFKINSSGNYVNSSITLTAIVNNTSIAAWQYSIDGAYTTYPGSGTSTSLTINTTDAPIISARNGNGTIKIKLVTTDANTYDIFTITILKDGIDAQSSVAAILSNEVQMLPANDDGTLITGALDDASTQLTIYEGGEDQTSTWTITRAASSGITLRSQSSNQQYIAAVTAMDPSALTGKVTFTCSKSGFPTFTKEFSLVKVMSGTDGVTPVVYSLIPNQQAVIESYTYTDGVDTPTVSRSPSIITFSAYQRVGAEAATPYEGRIQFFINGSNEMSAVDNTNRSSRSYDFSANSTTVRLKAVLYKAGANSEELDSQNVFVIKNGEKGGQGDPGPAGVDAASLVLINEADVIPCDKDGHPFQNFPINIPFEGYQGITKKATTVSSAPVLSRDTWGTDGDITPTIVNATASNLGTISYVIPTTATVPEHGNITLTFSVVINENTGVAISKVYSWTRSKAAADGANAVILTAVTPDGTVFENGEGILTIGGILYDGPARASNIEYHYYKYSSEAGNYVEISSTNTSSPIYIATQEGRRVLKVRGTSIDGYASFKISATYNNITYEEYVSLIDKTDPLQVSVHSTVGTQIKNAQGIGCLYVRVTREGTDIDPVPANIVVSETEPTNANDGDYFIKITKPTGTGTFNGNDSAYTGSARLMKYHSNSSSWIAQTPRCSYEWTYRNVNNVPLTANDKKPATTGQFVYIDGSLIQNKITADVKVTLNESS